MTLLNQIQELKSVLKDGLGSSEMLNLLASKIKCDVFLIDLLGNIVNSKEGTNLCLKPDFKQRISFVFDIMANVPLSENFSKDSAEIKSNIFMTIIPVRDSKSILGHLLLTKTSNQFSEEELILADFSTLLISIYLYKSTCANESASTKQSTIDSVMDSLSFSEIKALNCVLSELNGMEGVVVASKISDRIGISRSVVVNAMRKLESAGVLKSRSLGIKGTYFEIYNPDFVKALKEKSS
jgi:transcriptional pleiotropic repressor